MSGNETLWAWYIESHEEPFIWHPHLKFDNYIKFELTKSYGGTKQLYSFFSYSSENDTVIYGEEFKVTFSCPFNFKNYPFDNHECRMEYGWDNYFRAEWFNISDSMVVYNKFVTKNQKKSIIFDHMSLPFEFHLEVIPPFTKNYQDTNYSYSGMVIKMKRNDLGQLLGGFFFPTTSFALLSMVSFVIQADMVST